MDLGDLLPEALEWAFDRASDGADREKRRRFTTDTMNDWALAIATFMAVWVQSSPSLAIPLATFTTESPSWGVGL